MNKFYKSKLAQTTVLLIGSTGVFSLHQAITGNERFYGNVIMPTLHSVLDGENAHRIAVVFAKYGLVPKDKFVDPVLECKVWGKYFKNPIGIAAGFDKHAEAISGLQKMGFGFVEVGSITPLPQTGNSKPRVFRLSEDRSVINRYGFNSCGHDNAYDRLVSFKNKENEITLGINLGANKNSENRTKDYVTGIHKLGSLADYIVINISSPNTPGLRNLQAKRSLENLCEQITSAVKKLKSETKPALILKISPDLSDKDLIDIANVVEKYSIDGVIISNTTITRPSSLRSEYRNEQGGLSGPDLKEMSINLVRKFYKLTDGKVPIIGVGGVSSGKDAFDKITAGASLVQIYTSLVYNGPPVVSKIKQELVELLKDNGFNSVSEAVGTDTK